LMDFMRSTFYNCINKFSVGAAAVPVT
jgi:hypothetical protein